MRRLTLPLMTIKHTPSEVGPRALKIYMTNYQEMIVNARELYHQGKFSESEQVFSQLLGSPEFEAAGYNGIGMIKLRNGSLADAETAFEKALAINWSIADSHYGLGYVAERRGNKAKAEASYQNALQINPGMSAAAAALEGLRTKRVGTVPSGKAEVYKATGEMNLYEIFLADESAMSKEIVFLIDRLTTKDVRPQRTSYMGSYLLLTLGLAPFLIIASLVLIYAVSGMRF